jgi:ATP-dependent RNA helicase DDX49/DBP8
VVTYPFASDKMSHKRRALTTDDLMRMQEDGPARKRRKEEFSLAEEDDSDSELELPERHIHREADKGFNDAESESGESEEEEEEEKSSMASDPEQDEHPTIIHTLPDEDGVSSSRISIVPRTSLPTPRKPLTAPANQPISFAAMGISSALLAALAKMSIRTPTEIQAASIPPLLQGEHVVTSQSEHLLIYVVCKAGIA